MANISPKRYDYPVGIRLSPDQRDELKRHAAADDRALSTLVRRIVVDWLKQQQQQQPAREPREGVAAAG